MSTHTERTGSRMARDGTATIAKRGAAALLLSLATNAAIALAVRETGAVPSFDPLGLESVLTMTAAGAVGATVVYWLLARVTARPARAFTAVAVVVLLLSFVPDLTVAMDLPGATTAGVVVLMAMHVTVAAICVALLTGAAGGTRPA